MRTSLFPKHLPACDADALADIAQASGLDTVNALVREGFPIDEANLRHTLPKFVGDMARRGFRIDLASTTYPVANLLAPDSPLPILADSGIAEFRIGWFPLNSDPARALADARQSLLRLAERCQSVGIRAILQLHFGTLVSSPSAAHRVLEGVPPEWVGVELDPGNQAIEGLENWDYAVGLLGPHIAWVGIKDVAHAPPASWPARPRWSFVPVGEGHIDWPGLAAALARIRFDGVGVLMPFYSEDEAVLRAQLPTEGARLREFAGWIRR